MTIPEIPASIRSRVSRETADQLTVYVEELVRWQPALNLVSPATLPDVWTRHVEDGLQLVDLVPDQGLWADLGSGGGVPGLMVAAAEPGRPVALVESDARKCAFLRSAARRMGVNVAVHHGRIENVVAAFQPLPAVVSARALAPLPTLLAYAQPILTAGAVGLFPKGRNVLLELTEAQECWNFSFELVPSRTDREGRILRIRDLSPRAR